MGESGLELWTGEYRNTLDEKGRILFPAKLRSEFPDSTLVVTKGLDHCLWLFSLDGWQKLSSRLMESTGPFDTKNRQVLRRVIAPAQEVEIDGAGRLSIPASLREHAALSKDCVMLGIIKYVELWDAAAYRAYLEESEPLFREATEELGAIRL
ncbi:division/cell wall cluster transcriptional repressor MraZ [Treponema endosymbiont of Eucomonympha sp.]|uniref:division/cell wall cluster transcriptional repressor MraZ n=1 Tax=Treponema endosymbiont of Eucomonympha sp. TaxID=1580831 RepID=UPI001E5D62F2|nr:division/cell wall cluster transcriptional repressor MraZ [Treponema endosymbiont of Eucomonympha sp.]